MDSDTDLIYLRYRNKKKQTESSLLMFMSFPHLMLSVHVWASDQVSNTSLIRY